MVHILTLEHERVAEMNVPPVEMASVAIRLPQHLELEVSQDESTCQRDDKRKAFHALPQRTYPCPTPPDATGPSEMMP